MNFKSCVGVCYLPIYIDISRSNLRHQDAIGGIIHIVKLNDLMILRNGHCTVTFPSAPLKRFI